MKAGFIFVLFLTLIIQHCSAKKEKGKALEIELTDEGEREFNTTVGDNVKLICGTPVEIPISARTSWYLNGAFMDQMDFPNIVLTNMRLNIKKIKLSEAGSFSCEVRDDNQTNHIILARTITLKVEQKARKSKKATEMLLYDDDKEGGDEKEYQKLDKNIQCPENISKLKNETFLCFDINAKGKSMTHFLVKAAGSTVTLYCNAKGNPKPKIQWLKFGKVIEKKGYQHQVRGNLLEILDVTSSDEGEYVCSASNEHANLTYEILVEIVERSNSKPIFTTTPSNVTVLVGQTVELEVEILSDPEYSVVWLKHSLSDTQDTIRVQSRTSNLDLESDSNLLVLDNVTESDEGWYTCIAGNAVGRVATAAYINVVEEIPSVEVTEKKKSFRDPNLFIYVVVGGVFFIGFLIISFAFWKKKSDTRWRRQYEEKKLAIVRTKHVIIERRPAIDNDEGAILIPEVNIKSVESFGKPGQEYELPVDLAWEFPREKLELGKYLGEGAFGEVRMGVASGIIFEGVETTIAVKTLKKTHSDAELIDLISEMETMKELGKNVNIINLLGCCTQGGELLVLMEYAEHGNLRDFLRDKRNEFMYERPRVPGFDRLDQRPETEYNEADDVLTFCDLMSFAYQVARGMDYLVQRKYVHRDLAARNVLVTSHKVVKIADFGMTRSTFTNDYYRKKSDGRVPVKWMAPETLFHRIYTTQSDVWSYGILLWEIVTLGGTPYPSMPDANKLLDFLKRGKRMEQPANCPTELYLIMRDCWMDTPYSRPTFTDLVEDIGRILYIASGKDYMDLEGVRPLEEVITPPSSPENSLGRVMFDPDFVRSFSEP